MRAAARRRRGPGPVRARRAQAGLAVVAVAVAGTGALGAAALRTRHDAPTARTEATAPPSVLAAPAPPVTVPARPPVATTVPAAPVIPASAVLARPVGIVDDYASPGGTPVGTVGDWYGYALVTPVVARRPGWVDIRLPQRPNGSTAWVRLADVTLSSTPYRIVVDLATTHLTVYRAGRPVMAFPVGVGLPATPTVTGHYFVAVHEPHGNAVYGPVILDTSAHSDAIGSWEGAGDAIIAIHGPIDAAADAAIGTTGARVSNGCIRVHVDDLTQLSVIPPGTPVDIDP